MPLFNITSPSNAQVSLTLSGNDDGSVDVIAKKGSAGAVVFALLPDGSLYFNKDAAGLTALGFLTESGGRILADNENHDREIGKSTSH